MRSKIAFLFLIIVISLGCNSEIDSLAKELKKRYSPEFVPEAWTKDTVVLSGMKHAIYKDYPKNRYNWIPPRGGAQDSVSYINYDTIELSLLDPIKSNKMVFPVNSILPVLKSTEILLPPSTSRSNKNCLIPFIPFSYRHLNPTAVIYGKVFIYDDIESYIMAIKSSGYPIDKLDSYLLNIKNGRLLSTIRLSSSKNFGLGYGTIVSFHLPDGIIINKTEERGDVVGIFSKEEENELIKRDALFNNIDFTVFKVDKTGFVKMLGPDDVKASN